MFFCFLICCMCHPISTKMEEARFMTCTAACQQAMIKTLRLHFRGSSHVVHLYIQSTDTNLQQEFKIEKLFHSISLQRLANKLWVLSLHPLGAFDPNHHHSPLSPWHSAYWSADASQRTKKKNPWQSSSFCRCSRQAVGGVFVAGAADGGTECFSRPRHEAEPQTLQALPGQLALSWWQRRLSKNQSPSCLPAAPLHRFVGVGYGHVRQRKPVSARPECVFVFVCIKYNAEVWADLIFRCDYKWTSTGIFDISPSSYQNPAGGEAGGAVVPELMTLIKSGWLISFSRGCRMNVIIKSATNLYMSISWVTLPTNR